jgi:hypothetical protein
MNKVCLSKVYFTVAMCGLNKALQITSYPGKTEIESSSNNNNNNNDNNNNRKNILDFKLSLCSERCMLSSG